MGTVCSLFFPLEEDWTATGSMQYQSQNTKQCTHADNTFNLKSQSYKLIHRSKKHDKIDPDMEQRKKKKKTRKIRNSVLFLSVYYAQIRLIKRGQIYYK